MDAFGAIHAIAEDDPGGAEGLPERGVGNPQETPAASRINEKRGRGTGEDSPAPVTASALEEQAQRKLQIADVAGLAGDLSEGGKVGRIEAGAVPIRVVEDVERLGAELNSGLLREGDLLE